MQNILDLRSSILAILIAALIVLYCYNLGGYISNDDEGTFRYQAWQVSEGNELYQDLYSSRWPLFIYTGATAISWFGHTHIPLRIISLALTFGTAFLVYLLATRFSSRFGGLLSVVAYLFNPIVFENARFYTTEPFYIFFGMLGFYLFLRFYQHNATYWLVLTGFVFSISASYKVLGHLIIAGCIAYMVLRWILEPDNRRKLFTKILLLGGSHSIFYISIVGLVALNFPTFTEGVLGANFGDEPAQIFSLFSNYQQWLTTAIVYLVLNLPVIILVTIEYYSIRQKSPEIGALGWQIPTAIAFILLSRKLFIRLFVYLNPFFAILFGISLDNLQERKWGYRFALVASFGTMVLINYLYWPTNILRPDQATQQIIQEIEQLTEPNDIVFSDYQEFNFFAKRQSTFSGAEISNVLILNGALSADEIIEELTKSDVKLLILDRDGQHMMSLPDLDKLEAFLDTEFELSQSINRFPRREYSTMIEFWIPKS